MMLYHGGFLPEDYGKIQTSLARPKKRKRKSSGCSSLAQIRKGKATKRYGTKKIITARKRFAVGGEIATTAAGIAAVTATVAPPWSTVLAILPALVAVGTMAGSGIMGRRARILSNDPKLLKKWIKRARKWSKPRRKRVTQRKLRRYRRHCSRGNRYTWFGLGRRKIKKRRLWKVREARLRMWLTALYLANQKKKKKSQKDDFVIVEAHKPRVSPPKQDWTGLMMVGGAIIIGVSILYAYGPKDEK